MIGFNRRVVCKMHENLFLFIPALVFFLKKNHFIVLWGRGPYVGHSPVRGGLAPALHYRRYIGRVAGVLSIENKYSASMLSGKGRR